MGFLFGNVTNFYYICDNKIINMADFSKQWCEIHDPEMPWDFDIEVEAENIPKGHYKPIICEGFGFGGIGVRMDGSIMLLFADYVLGESNEITYKQIDYDKFIQKQKLKSSGI